MVLPTICGVTSTRLIPIRSLLLHLSLTALLSLHSPNRTGTPRSSLSTPLLLRHSTSPACDAARRTRACTSDSDAPCAVIGDGTVLVSSMCNSSNACSETWWRIDQAWRRVIVRAPMNYENYRICHT